MDPIKEVANFVYVTGMVNLFRIAIKPAPLYQVLVNIVVVSTANSIMKK